VFVIYLERPEYLWALTFVAIVLAMHEFFAMTLREDALDRRASLVVGSLAAAGMYWLSPGYLAAWTGSAQLAGLGPVFVIILSVMPIALYYLFRFGDMKTVAPRLAYSVAGIVYVGLLLAFIPMLKRDFPDFYGSDWVVFVLLVAWIGDTGAYFAGRFLGKRKLYPAVSPKKTWAGAMGGIAASALAAAAVKLTMIPAMTWVDVAVLSVPGAILGQMGDLVESLIKRSTGVKDSGALLPGHGGILDRVDALIFMGPYVYVYLLLKTSLG
ncbi:MAG: phosphatidate cytidylyltransferase, partial [Myxococcota bacterium]